MESSINQDGEISFAMKYFRNHIYFLRHMTRISPISISLILVVYFLDQSGYQFPYLDFLCSSCTPDFLPTEKSTKGLAPIAGTIFSISIYTYFHIQIYKYTFPFQYLSSICKYLKNSK